MPPVGEHEVAQVDENVLPVLRAGAREQPVLVQVGARHRVRLHVHHEVSLRRQVLHAQTQHLEARPIPPEVGLRLEQIERSELRVGVRVSVLGLPHGPP